VAQQLHALLKHAPDAGRLPRVKRAAVGQLLVISREVLCADAVDVYVVDRATRTLKRYQDKNAGRGGGGGGGGARGRGSCSM
jgi:hypothetical protein